MYGDGREQLRRVPRGIDCLGLKNVENNEARVGVTRIEGRCDRSRETLTMM